MLIVQRPQVTETESHTCRFHEENPGVPWPGCTCTATFSSRDKRDDEMTDQERDDYYRALAGKPPRCRHCGQ